ILYTKTSKELIQRISKMDDIEQDFTKDLKNVLKIEMIESSLDPETPKNSFTGQTQTSEDQSHSISMMADSEQDFTNDLKNVMKIEKLESSLHSETLEVTSTGHTFEEFLAERQKNIAKQTQEMISNEDVDAGNTPQKDELAENLKDFSYNKKTDL
ncbi:zinc finger protein OZF-like isoform X1, partial [Biomphalaria pfeifferi]